MTTANINSAPFNTIDATYPIAGQDNNTQGFRNNYTYIVQSFQSANVDITGLWANVDSLNSNVSLFGNISVLLKNIANISNISSNVSTLQSNVAAINLALANATVQTFSAQSYGPGTATVTLNYLTGAFQQITAAGAGNVTLAFTNWPNQTPNVAATMDALISVDAGYTLTFPAAVVLPAMTSVNTSVGQLIVGNITNVQSRQGQTLTSLVTGNYLFQFSTFNGGSTVLVTEKSVTY